MGLKSRLLDSSGVLGLFVLSLLTIGGEAFAPASTCSSLRSSSSPNNNTCSTANHNSFLHSLPLINQKAQCNENIPPHRKFFGCVLCRYATATTDGEEVVHAISRAFLAEQKASGRVMTKRDQNWWARFGELEEYRKEHGDCNVPYKYKANPQLGRWVSKQRQMYQQKKLSSERVEALESIGFEWTRPLGKLDDKQWWKRLGELKEYKQIHSDCNVPISYEVNPQLSKWVMNQRANYHRFFDENCKQSPVITEERIKALNEIGFEWRLRNRPEWDERFDELVAYKEQHGDTLVPIDLRRDSNSKYYDLAQWVHTQRTQYRFLQEGKHSHLTEERMQNLNQIGFVWDAQEAAWDERYDELVSYKKIHGDTLVCQASQLGNWVDNQRKEYQLLQRGKHSNLTNKRIGKLDQIGFVWSVLEDAWEEKFAELVEFKAAHGHTDVPKSWENQQLFWWVSVQRREYRKLKEGKITGITEERIQRLEDLGFEWRSKNTYRWKIRLGELRDFYGEKGVAPVPRAEHPTLYNWATKQKKEYDKFVRGEKTNMDEERINDLERIGFFDIYVK